MNQVLVLHVNSSTNGDRDHHHHTNIIHQLLNISHTPITTTTSTTTNNPNTESDTNSTTTTTTQCHSFNHPIQTKYYDATLSFSLIQLDNITRHLSSSLSSSSPQSLLKSSIPSHIQNPHAVIISFHTHHDDDDHTEHENDEKLLKLLNELFQQVRLQFDQSLEVCLCVSLPSSSSSVTTNDEKNKNKKNNDKFFSSLNSLALQEQFELVRHDATDDAHCDEIDERRSDEDDSTHDSIFYEKFGSERVWEALKSTMWPHMEKPTLASSVKSSMIVRTRTDDHAVDKNVENGENGVNKNGEVDPLCDSRSDDAKLLEELMNQVFRTEEEQYPEEKDPEEITENSCSSSNSKKESESQQQNVEQEQTGATNEEKKRKKSKKNKKDKQQKKKEKDDAEEFDKLLNAMLHMRKNAATMSDQDRKKRAADLAMSLFSMLGEEEGDGQEE